MTTLSSSGADSGDDESPESDEIVEADDSTETLREQQPSSVSFLSFFLASGRMEDCLWETLANMCLG